MIVKIIKADDEWYKDYIGGYFIVDIFTYYFSSDTKYFTYNVEEAGEFKGRGIKPEHVQIIDKDISKELGDIVKLTRNLENKIRYGSLFTRDWNQMIEDINVIKNKRREILDMIDGKIVKFKYEDQILEGVYIKDNYFAGGGKILYNDKIISSILVEIL